MAGSQLVPSTRGTYIFGEQTPKAPTVSEVSSPGPSCQPGYWAQFFRIWLAVGGESEEVGVPLGSSLLRDRSAFQLSGKDRRQGHIKGCQTALPGWPQASWRADFQGGPAGQGWQQ